MAKFCRYCGKPLGDNDKFCSFCGSLVEETTTQPITQTSLQPTNNHTVPQQISSYRDKSFRDKFFSGKGRLNRRLFILRNFVLGLIIIFCYFIALETSSILSLFFSILCFITWVSGLCITIQRLHDLNRSGYYCLISLIPFINFLLLIYLFVFKGTTGENKYGPDPLQ